MMVILVVSTLTPTFVGLVIAFVVISITPCSPFSPYLTFADVPFKTFID